MLGRKRLVRAATARGRYELEFEFVLLLVLLQIEIDIVTETSVLLAVCAARLYTLCKGISHQDTLVPIEYALASIGLASSPHVKARAKEKARGQIALRQKSIKASNIY